MAGIEAHSQPPTTHSSLNSDTAQFRNPSPPRSYSPLDSETLELAQPLSLDPVAGSASVPQIHRTSSPSVWMETLKALHEFTSGQAGHIEPGTPAHTALARVSDDLLEIVNEVELLAEEKETLFYLNNQLSERGRNAAEDVKSLTQLNQDLRVQVISLHKSLDESKISNTQSIATIQTLTEQLSACEAGSKNPPLEGEAPKLDTKLSDADDLESVKAERDRLKAMISETHNQERLEQTRLEKHKLLAAFSAKKIQAPQWGFSDPQDEDAKEWNRLCNWEDQFALFAGQKQPSHEAIREELKARSYAISDLTLENERLKLNLQRAESSHSFTLGKSFGCKLQAAQLSLVNKDQELQTVIHLSKLRGDDLRRRLARSNANVEQLTRANRVLEAAGARTESELTAKIEDTQELATDEIRRLKSQGVRPDSTEIQKWQAVAENSAFVLTRLEELKDARKTELTKMLVDFQDTVTMVKTESQHFRDKTQQRIQSLQQFIASREMEASARPNISGEHSSKLDQPLKDHASRLIEESENAEALASRILQFVEDIARVSGVSPEESLLVEDQSRSVRQSLTEILGEISESDRAAREFCTRLDSSGLNGPDSKQKAFTETQRMLLYATNRFTEAIMKSKQLPDDHKRLFEKVMKSYRQEVSRTEKEIVALDRRLAKLQKSDEDSEEVYDLQDQLETLRQRVPQLELELKDVSILADELRERKELDDLKRRELSKLLGHHERLRAELYDGYVQYRRLAQPVELVVKPLRELIASYNNQEGCPELKLRIQQVKQMIDDSTETLDNLEIEVQTCLETKQRLESDAGKVNDLETKLRRLAKATRVRDIVFSADDPFSAQKRGTKRNPESTARQNKTDKARIYEKTRQLREELVRQETDIRDAKVELRLSERTKGTNTEALFLLQKLANASKVDTKRIKDEVAQLATVSTSLNKELKKLKDQFSSQRGSVDHAISNLQLYLQRELSSVERDIESIESDKVTLAQKLDTAIKEKEVCQEEIEKLVSRQNILPGALFDLEKKLGPQSDSDLEVQILKKQMSLVEEQLRTAETRREAFELHVEQLQTQGECLKERSRIHQDWEKNLAARQDQLDHIKELKGTEAQAIEGIVHSKTLSGRDSARSAMAEHSRSRKALVDGYEGFNREKRSIEIEKVEASGKAIYLAAEHTRVLDQLKNLNDYEEQIKAADSALETIRKDAGSDSSRATFEDLEIKIDTARPQAEKERHTLKRIMADARDHLEAVNEAADPGKTRPWGPKARIDDSVADIYNLFELETKVELQMSEIEAANDTLLKLNTAIQTKKEEYKTLEESIAEAPEVGKGHTKNKSRTVNIPPPIHVPGPLDSPLAVQVIAAATAPEIPSSIPLPTSRKDSKSSKGKEASTAPKAPLPETTRKSSSLEKRHQSLPSGANTPKLLSTAGPPSSSRPPRPSKDIFETTEKQVRVDRRLDILNDQIMSAERALRRLQERQKNKFKEDYEDWIAKKSFATQLFFQGQEILRRQVKFYRRMASFLFCILLWLVNLGSVVYWQASHLPYRFKAPASLFRGPELFPSTIHWPTITARDLLHLFLHVLFFLAVQLYISAKREREIWLSANSLTRYYLLDITYETPYRFFLPDLDPRLMVTFGDVSEFFGWLWLSARNMVPDVVVEGFEILVEAVRNYENRRQ